MEKINKYIAITISILVLSFSGWFIINPKKTFSENEFRYLETFPTFHIDSFLNGEYIKKLENYFNDQFPLRDRFVEIKTEVFYYLGNRFINDVYIAKDHFLIQQFARPENSDKIINILNTFKEKNKDVEIQMILSPTATSIYQELLPWYHINYSEKEVIDYYYKNLNIKGIDIFDILMEEKENYQLFYRTDHHWTTYGAYFAYRRYCEENNITALEIEDFHIELVSDDFLGTLYSKVFYGANDKDTIYSFQLENSNFTVEYLDKITNSLYNEDYLTKKDKYSYFLDNNHPFIKITNHNVNNGKELLIIKDSYANSFIPILANHYEKIHVIDPRYYNMPITDYIKDNDIKNALLLYNVNSIDTDQGVITIR